MLLMRFYPSHCVFKTPLAVKIYFKIEEQLLKVFCKTPILFILWYSNFPQIIISNLNLYVPGSIRIKH